MTKEQERQAAEGQSAAPVDAPTALSTVPTYAIVVGGTRYPVASLQDASEKFSYVRERVQEEQGPRAATMHNVAPAVIEENGNPIGYVAFNGRVFAGPPQTWTKDTPILYDPRPSAPAATTGAFKASASSAIRWETATFTFKSHPSDRRAGTGVWRQDRHRTRDRRRRAQVGQSRPSQGTARMTKDDRLRDELMGLTHDTDCPDCHIRAESRTCEDCGRTLTITDCGHYQQPRPIAASQYQGHGYACAACEQARATAVRDDAIDDDR